MDKQEALNAIFARIGKLGPMQLAELVRLNAEAEKLLDEIQRENGK